MRHRPLAWALSSLGVSNLAWGAAFTIGAPLLADRVLAGQVGAYGLIVGAYGVGNVIGNIVVGSMHVRRRLGDALRRADRSWRWLPRHGDRDDAPIAFVGSAVAAFGGPMGDIVLLTMIQHDLPANQIGKVYSLRMTIANAGISLGAVVAAPLYATFSVGVGISLCAALIAMTGLVGFLRYGVTEPAVPAPAT